MLKKIFEFTTNLEQKSFEEINSFCSEIKKFLCNTTNIENDFYFPLEQLFNKITIRFTQLNVLSDFWFFFVDNVYNSASVTAILIKEQNDNVELINYWKNNIIVGLEEYDFFVNFKLNNATI
jgi:hypothetical protein